MIIKKELIHLSRKENPSSKEIEQKLPAIKNKNPQQTNPSKKGKLQFIEENKKFSNGLLVVLLLLVFFASSYKISGDDDFFWHLATGRYIVENKVVPDTDVFGFVSQGSQWIPFEWGWDVLTYSLNNIGGYNAILIFRSIAFTLIFFVYYMLFRKFKVNSLISILMLFALLVSIMDRLSPRPHVITYLFFSIILYLLLSFKYFEREHYIKKLYFLPLVFLIWGNMHLGVLAGGLFLFVFTITEIIIFYNPRKFFTSEIIPLSKEHLLKLLIISAACALVLLLNPHGIQTYIYAYNHTKMKLLETVNEWRSPFDGGGFTASLYRIFLYAGVLVLFYAYKKKDLLSGLVYIAFAIYSARKIRFTVDYNFIMIFFLTMSVNYIIVNLKSYKSGLTGKLLKGNPAKVVVGVFLIFLITQIPSNNIYTAIQYYRPSGWGIDNDFMPVELFKFAIENNISGKPFNQFGTGGYIVWNFPGQQNFIDSRNLNDDIFNEYNSIMSMRPGFEKKLEKYGIDYVVYLDPDMTRRPTDLKSVIVAYLSRNPNWKLVFWDDKSFLFVKNIPKFSEVINKYEYKVINPYTAIFFKQEFDNNIKNNSQIAKDELNRKKEGEPNGYLYQTLNQEVSKILNGL